MNFIENVGDVCIYDCEAFCVKLIRKTERNELIWEDAKKIREKYDVDKLFNSSANGIFKYKTLFMNTQVIFSCESKDSKKLFNLEFFPEGDNLFYCMPFTDMANIVRRFEQLEELIERQTMRRDSEIIAKIMEIS